MYLCLHVYSMDTCHIQFTCESQIRELTGLHKSWWGHIILEDVIFPKKGCNGPHNRCVNIWTRRSHMETQLLACKYRLAKDLGESIWLETKRREAANIGSFRPTELLRCAWRSSKLLVSNEKTHFILVHVNVCMLFNVFEKKTSTKFAVIISKPSCSCTAIMNTMWY